MNCCCATLVNSERTSGQLCWVFAPPLQPLSQRVQLLLVRLNVAPSVRHDDAKRSKHQHYQCSLGKTIKTLVEAQPPFIRTSQNRGPSTKCVRPKSCSSIETFWPMCSERETLKLINSGDTFSAYTELCVYRRKNIIYIYIVEEKILIYSVAVNSGRITVG